MRSIRRGLFAATLVSTMVVLAGCSSGSAAAPAAADRPEIDSPDHESGEQEATVDPDAKGTPPEAFTVAGTSVRIDVRALKAKPKKRERTETEAELRESGQQGSARRPPCRPTSARPPLPRPS